MRIGERLLNHGWIDWETLALAVTDQPGTGLRLCSLLVAQGKLDFDLASRVLGEQFRTPAALRKHLEHRDRSLAPLLPATIARARMAVPIGRLGTGTLLVCVRDPSNALHAALERAIGEPVVLAVAPARYVERIVEETYKPRPDAEIAMLDADLVADDEPDAAGSDFDIDVEDKPAPPANDLVLEIETTAPAAANRALPVTFKPIAAKRAATERDSLDATLAACKEIDERGWLFDVVQEYLTGNYRSSMLLELRDLRAVGIRGHGPRLKPAAVKTLVVTIEDSRLVCAARDERRLLEEPPTELGSEDDVLITALGASSPPIVAGLATGRTVHHVLLVGDPVKGDREDAIVDLGLLVEAVSDALSRMSEP